MAQIIVTSHAILRYRQRFDPRIGRRGAERKIRRLLDESEPATGQLLTRVSRGRRNDPDRDWFYHPAEILLVLRRKSRQRWAVITLFRVSPG